MVFDPKLQGGVAFNQPVSQPNAMEAVAGLFNFGMSSLASSGEALLSLRKTRSLLWL